MNEHQAERDDKAPWDLGAVEPPAEWVDWPAFDSDDYRRDMAAWRHLGQEEEATTAAYWKRRFEDYAEDCRRLRDLVAQRPQQLIDQLEEEMRDCREKVELLDFALELKRGGKATS